MKRGRVVAALLVALGSGLAAQAAAQGLDQTLAARQKAIPKGKRAFQETFLLPPGAGGAAKDMKLAAKVAVFQDAPRERIEINPVSGNAFGDPVVIVGNGKDYFLITKVGSTPLAKSAKASDPLVLQALASPPGDVPKKREVKGADGSVVAVVYREPRDANFSSSTAFSMKPARVGDSLLKKNLAMFGESEDRTVTASAGARGVDEIQTPNGKVSVTPDSSAVVWLESRDVGPLAFEAFLVEGSLGPYATEEGQ